MKVNYLPSAEKQLGKIDRKAQKIIRDYMDSVAEMENPRLKGDGLKGNLAGLWRYRVMDYRIVCRILDDVLEILVVHIGHRREVYKQK